MTADRPEPARRWSPHLFRTRHFAIEQTRKRSWPVFSCAAEALGREAQAGGAEGPPVAHARVHDELRRSGWDEDSADRAPVQTYTEWSSRTDCSLAEHLTALLDVLRISRQAPAERGDLSRELPSGLARPAAVSWLVGFLRSRLDQELESGSISTDDYTFTDEVIAALAVQSPVGDRIRAARTAVGMSQSDLAEALGASVASVVTWERAVRPVDERYRSQLAQLLSLPVDQLE
jgi:DNA-binding transcriptional regulator YiaG